MSGMTVRRVKTYVAQTGFVYQYYFVGKRSALNSAQGTEYVFDVTSDRKTMFAVSVFLLPEALEAWGAHHGRPLSDTEQYATAKLRLHQGFDAHANMLADGRQLEVDATNVEEVLEPLRLS